MAFKFQGFDFLHLDASLTEEERLVRRTARDFADSRVIPIIEGCFREGRFPRELVPLMGEMGFYDANLGGYGCAGMSNVEYGLVMQELERGDSEEKLVWMALKCAAGARHSGRQRRHGGLPRHAA
jgi:glutaryl-CoA dehydrogenase